MILGELLAHVGFKVEHEPLERLEHQLEGIKERLNLIIGYEAVTKLFELSERFAHWGMDLALTASNIGITTEALQSLDFAAEKSGISQEEMTHSLAHLSRALYEARNGSKEMQAHFARAGITSAQVAGFKNSEDALMALADQLNHIQDPIKRMAVSQELMGRGGFKMVAFLSQGSRAIREEGAELRKLGLQLSGPQIHALVEVEHAFHRLHSVMNAIGSQIAAYVGPAFSFLVDKFIALYGANKNMVGSAVTSWLDALLYGLGYVSGTIYNLTKRLMGMGGALKGAFDVGGMAGVFELLEKKINKIFSPENLAGLTAQLQKMFGSEGFAAAIKAALDAATVATGWAANIGFEIAKGFIAAAWAGVKGLFKTDATAGELLSQTVDEINTVFHTMETVQSKVTVPGAVPASAGGVLGSVLDTVKTDTGVLKGIASRVPGAVATSPSLSPNPTSPIATTPRAALTNVTNSSSMTNTGGKVSIHAPTTVNVSVPPGSSPDHAAAMGKEAGRAAAKELHGEILRQTMQSLPSGS